MIQRSPHPHGEDAADPPVPPALSELPDEARVWIYGTSRSLTGDEVAELRESLAAFVDRWSAHGARLRASAVVLHDRFALVAADEGDARASGCSIDGLVRHLGELETRLGCSFLDGSRLFFRGSSGAIESCDRETFRRFAADGRIDGETPVFDLTLAALGEVRAGRFELPLRDSWHGRLVPEVAGTA